MREESANVFDAEKIADVFVSKISPAVVIRRIGQNLITESDYRLYHPGICVLCQVSHGLALSSG